MKKNKLILNHCPNFHKIINFDFFEDDIISGKLITLYQDFIFKINTTDEVELKMVEKIDYVLNKYIEDYYFRQEIRNNLRSLHVSTDGNFLKNIVESIINSYERFESGYTRNIYFARWI